MNFEQARFNMVEQQIRPWQVLDREVLAVLSQLRRELFVPAAHQALAYVDTDIPLGHGQSLSAPRIDARLMHDLHLKGTEKVLEIGTGSGYLTALLAARAQRVISLERHAELASQARSNLQRAGVTNAEVRVADGSQGAAGDAPFDAIVLGGSVAEVPQALLTQLAIGGQLIAVVGVDNPMRAVRVTRTANDQWTRQTLWDTVLPALEGFPEPARFQF